MSRPRVFIGSSIEGLEVAEAVQLGLDYDAECTIWSQGVFGLSSGTLESLLRAVKDFEFAILVLSPDDLIHKRGTARNSPRDNVLFELGLFMGALGRERTYLVLCRDKAIDLPTDLAGVAVADYGHRADGNLQAALGSVCTRIKTAIRNAGRDASSRSTKGDVNVVNLSTEIQSLKSELAAQRETVRHMFESLMSSRTLPEGIRPKAVEGGDVGLKFFEGAWKGLGEGTMAYARMVGDELRFVYCFGGNEWATGEYFELRLVEGSLLGRFRWLDDAFEGYVYWEIVTRNRVKGGWWSSRDVSAHMAERIPDVSGMNSSEFVRQDEDEPVPRWVDEYFNKFKLMRKGRASPA